MSCHGLKLGHVHFLLFHFSSVSAIPYWHTRP
jgi:hypothetical protein